MPFTISHAIAGIAIHKISPYRLSLSALIIGSMMPDAEYFLRMKMYGIYGHTLPGIFVLDLPLGLLIYWLFQKIIKYPLILHLPLFLRRRFGSFLALPTPQNNAPKLSLQRITVISIAILIGIMTHIIWDAFTHATGFFVTLFPLLQQQITLFNITFPLYKLLQQLCSIMGLAAIILYIAFLPKSKTTLLSFVSRRYQCLFIAIFFVIIGIRLGWNFTSQYGHLIVIILSAFFLSLLITALIWHYHHRKLFPILKQPNNQTDKRIQQSKAQHCQHKSVQ